MDWSDELRTLFKTDQEDRQRFLELTADERRVLFEADGPRCSRVREILVHEYPLSAEDRYHAAMVLQHGETVEDIERARALALEAAHANYRPARWLAAAALDRMRMYRGEPQVYGTQFVCEGRTWKLWDVEGTATDDDRAEWDVPPLLKQMAFAESLNAMAANPSGGSAPSSGAAGGQPEPC